MPNGKGSLDCSYCIHFDGTGYPDGHAEERLCRFHQTVLPKPKVEYHNRICGNFKPNELCFAHNPSRQFFPLARRFAWFSTDLDPGVLYEFCYNTPSAISKTAVLRIPDYQNRTVSNDWTSLGSATEISPGQFQFTDTQATNFPQRFYQIRSP